MEGGLLMNKYTIIQRYKYINISKYKEIIK